MRNSGYEDLYESFPYHQNIYAHCNALWKEHAGSLLEPYSDLHKKASPDASRLRYQFQKLLTAALFSVDRTKGGLLFPSMDGNLKLDFVPIDPETIGKANAGQFWPNIEWLTPFFRDAVGPGNIPIEPHELFTKCPKFEGNFGEAVELIAQLMSEAYSLKRSVIPPGAYHPIENGGLLKAVRLHEFGREVAATFVTQTGRFFLFTMAPADGAWRLHVPSGERLAIEFPEILNTAEDDQQLFAAYDAITRPVEVGLALFVATLIRDFWVLEDRESIFSEKRSVRSITPCWIGSCRQQEIFAW